MGVENLGERKYYPSISELQIKVDAMIRHADTFEVSFGFPGAKKMRERARFSIEILARDLHIDKNEFKQ